jgi:hypothetical protein
MAQATDLASTRNLVAVLHMSRFSTMPRAYRRQLQATDQHHVDQITRTSTDPTIRAGTPGALRGIPAIGPNCPGHIRDTDPGGNLIRTNR